MERHQSLPNVNAREPHQQYGARYNTALSFRNNITLPDDVVDHMLEDFAAADNFKKKTWTRRIVEGYLSKYHWYFPSRSIRNPPSLSKAYAYYEHITLPRKFVGDNSGGQKHIHRRAEPGESAESTDLYNPFTTPSSAFIEWGIGVDLYFSTVRSMSIILFIAGLISLPNILFYASTEYSPNGQDSLGLITLHGTAICTTFNWVVCSDCDPESYKTPEEESRFGVAEDGTQLVLRNMCKGGQLEQGVVNLIAFFVVAVLMTVFSIYLRAREIRFDEDKLTSTDYTVLVRNPPPDLYDPDVWRDFFEQFAEKQVTVVTLGLNNNELLNKLIVRRILRNELRLKLPKNTNLDDEDMVRSAVARYVQERESENPGIITKILGCTAVPILNIFNMFLSAEKLVDKIFVLTQQIKELQKKEYQVKSVFVTFETEQGQRAALDALSVGKIDVMMQNKSSLPPSAVFHGRVLKVREPSEPSAVRWRDLGSTMSTRFTMRIVNLAITIALVSFSGYLVNLTRKDLGPYFAGPLVSISNFLIPIIVKILMIFEPHTSEGSYQTSLLLKIAMFRWVNTAILVKLITPFTSTVTDSSQDLIKSIHGLLWSELWLTPVLRLIDIVGNIKKHIIAPRTHTQEQMNSWFQGTFYNLSERYTDLTKVLFLCVFNSALFPSAFFFGSVILLFQYYSDKYCLMRIWGWSPMIGSELATFSRRYFLSGACLAFILVSAYSWAQFPYDNLCVPTTYDGPPISETFTNVELLTGEIIESITVNQETPIVSCSQSWRASGFSFPPTERLQPDGKRWMSDSQVRLVNRYGFTSLGVFIAFIIIFFGSAMKQFILSWFKGVWRPFGRSQMIDFSSNLEVFGYVPQIKLIGQPFPFLIADVDKIDQDLIGWNDPSKSYDAHNLIFDVPYPGLRRRKIIDKNTRNTDTIMEQEGYKAESPKTKHKEGTAEGLSKTPIYSIVKHYPPEWAR